MKKFFTIICTLALVFVSVFSFVGCTNDDLDSVLDTNTTFTYVHLLNNSTGFTTDPNETSISIGVRKGEALLPQINDALDTLTDEFRNNLMRSMVDFKKSSENTFTPGTNAEIIESNEEFRVAMECGYEPFNWTQNNSSNGAVPISGISGKYANGYDVQIARIVANALGRKLVIVQYDWESLLEGLKSNTFDAIIAGMSPTNERKEEIDFSNYYYTSPLVIITKEGSRLATATSLIDIDKSGIKIAAQPGTSHLTLLTEQTHNCTVISNLEDFPAMRIALEAGTIDGYVAEEPTAMALIK